MAIVASFRTAGDEATARRKAPRQRDLSRNRRQFPLLPPQMRHRRQQRPGIGMGRMPQQSRGPPGFHDHPAIHHRHLIGQLRHNAEIVRDQNHRHAVFPAQRIEQFENLSLNGHIQRGGRLVRNQQFRLSGQRHRNHHPLLHAAGKLMRKGLHPPRRIGNADLRQQPHDLVVDFMHFRPVKMDHLRNLVADAENRIQRRSRFLKDVGDAAAAHPAQFARRERRQVAFLAGTVAETNRSGNDFRARRQQPGQGQTAQALAATALADQRQNFSAPQGETDLGSHRHPAGTAAEPDRQIFHFEDHLAHELRTSGAPPRKRLRWIGSGAETLSLT
ncbi:hypothetical protein SDC9_117388 [bioreactor metagenome]|uniref:Uncharacterized protein n=1 Tax=bioreactor metagenome TaxID=1076179 RepID=A0A645C512_9ZZZZ